MFSDPNNRPTKHARPLRRSHWDLHDDACVPVSVWKCGGAGVCGCWKCVCVCECVCMRARVKRVCMCVSVVRACCVFVCCVCVWCMCVFVCCVCVCACVCFCALRVVCRCEYVGVCSCLCDVCVFATVLSRTQKHAYLRLHTQLFKQMCGIILVFRRHDSDWLRSTTMSRKHKTGAFETPQQTRTRVPLASSTRKQDSTD